MKFGSWKAEIGKCPTSRTFSKVSFHQRSLWIYRFQFLDGDLCLCVTLTDLTDWSLVKISVETEKCRSRGTAEKLLFKILPKYLFYSDDFPFIKAFFGNRTQSCLVASSVT